MVIIIIPLWLFFSYSNVIACHQISSSDFSQISNKVYVSPGLNNQQKKVIPYLVNYATKRLENFWGQSTHNSTLIFCATPQEYNKYCKSSEGAGCSLSTPFGDNFIIIDGSSINLDVIAHEMGHQEINSRVGWKISTFDIPQWFHEGIALMLDYRIVPKMDSTSRFLSYRQKWYMLHATSPTYLTELESMKDFFGGNELQTNKAYVSAGTEVSYWLRYVGKKGLQSLFEQLKKGNNFHASYQIIEQQAQSDSLVKPLKNPVRIPFSNSSYPKE